VVDIVGGVGRRTGDSRFLAALGMTARKANANANANAEAKTKAKAKAKTKAKAEANTEAKYRGLSTAHDVKPPCFGRDDEFYRVALRC
jgi:hypothetical protein